MTTQHPEALRLADELDAVPETGADPQTIQDAAAELRRQHARIAELEARLEAIGAGGVSGQLMDRAPLAASAGSEPVAGAVLDSEGSVCLIRRGTERDYIARRGGSLLYTHPSPPEGMVGGWVSVEERLPESDAPVLAHNGKWTGVAAWMSGDYLEPLERWQDEHREFIEMMGPAVTHWMPLPPPPSSAKGVAHG